MSDEHQPFIKTPKQLIAVIVLSFVIPIALIIMMVNYIGDSKRDGSGSGALTSEAIAHRIAPVARFELVDASAPKTLASGEQVYTAQCSACHAAGVAGAPKFGDTAAWEPRLATGYDALLQSALKGKGAMAPQSGGSYSDFEIGRAVVYMANEAGGELAEPEAPAKEGDEAAATASTDSAAPAAQPAAAAPATAAQAAKETVTDAADKVAAAAGSAVETAGAAVTAAAGKAADTVQEAGATAEAAVAPAHDLAAGKKLYDTACMVCHAAGVAGAPKFGDAAAWAGRVERGVEELTKVVITGKGAMPPRGTATQASDEEIGNAVAYMVSEIK